MSRSRFSAGIVLACICAATRAHAQDMCQAESECSFKKPNVLLVLDYSSSMTGFATSPAYFPPGQTATTRWGAELDAATWILRYQDGFFADNTRIGLTRFAHDPDLKDPGTTVATDTSFPPITDGFAIDVPFDGSDGEYLECKGSGVEAAVEVLRGAPPPPIVIPPDPKTTMFTWTRGALRSAHELIERTRKSHAGESGREAARLRSGADDRRRLDLPRQDRPIVRRGSGAGGGAAETGRRAGVGDRVRRRDDARRR